MISQGVIFELIFSLVFGKLGVDDLISVVQIFVVWFVDVFYLSLFFVVKGSVKMVRFRFVWFEVMESSWVKFDYFSDVFILFEYVLVYFSIVVFYVNGEVMVVRYYEFFWVNFIVSDWVNSYLVVVFWSVSNNFFNWSIVFVEQFFWFVRFYLVNEYVFVFYVVQGYWNWNLVCMEGVFDWVVV